MYNRFNALDPLNKVRIINNSEEMRRRRVHTKPGKNIPFEIFTPEYNKDNNIKYDNNGNVVYKKNTKVTWASRNSVVHLFVFCQNKHGNWFLLGGKRGGNGLWNVPGGYLDFGDTLKSAASRECFEETGVKIETKNIKQYFCDDNFDKNGSIEYYFYTVITNNTIENIDKNVFNTRVSDYDGEISKVKWFSITNLKKTNKLWLKCGKYKGGQVKMALDIYTHITNIMKKTSDYTILISTLNKMNKNGTINNVVYKKIVELLK